jgi:hypothetical protein
MDQRKKTPDRQKKNPAGGMDVCVCYTRTSMEHKWHEEGRKDLKVQNGSKGKNGTGKKIPVQARLSAPVQIAPGAHPCSYKMGTGSLPRG